MIKHSIIMNFFFKTDSRIAGHVLSHVSKMIELSLSLVTTNDKVFNTYVLKN